MRLTSLGDCGWRFAPSRSLRPSSPDQNRPANSEFDIERKRAGSQRDPTNVQRYARRKWMGIASYRRCRQPGPVSNLLPNGLRARTRLPAQANRERQRLGDVRAREKCAASTQRPQQAWAAAADSCSLAGSPHTEEETILAVDHDPADNGLCRCKLLSRIDARKIFDLE